MTLAGDFDYERGGHGYARQRRSDPRIAAQVHAALGDARIVINVGAGAGSYEPIDRRVVAIEPSAVMRSQRPPEVAPALSGQAEALPFPDAAFDAAMAMVTIHHWSDPVTGLRELRRVTRGPVVILTFDGETLDRFWLADYVPELIAAERARFPTIRTVCEVLGGVTEVQEVPIPIDCVDGFTEAYYARPEAFLDPIICRSQSAWGFVDPGVAERGIEKLRDDLASGRWENRYGHLRHELTFTGSLTLIVGRPQ